MKRLALALLLSIVLAGCTAPDGTAPGGPPLVAALEIVAEEQGWVQVRITGISTSGYMLRWGDEDHPHAVTNVVPGDELYAHFYQAVEGPSSGEQIPTEYSISLLNPEGQVIAQETVVVERVDCHLSLLSVDGRLMTVRYWGRYGIDYSVSWGDGTALHFTISTQSGTGILRHTYANAGTYTVGMEEIWAFAQPFFTVTVE